MSEIAFLCFLIAIALKANINKKKTLPSRFHLGPIPWAYMGEIFPTRLKGTASSSAAFFNWMLAFIVTISFPSAVDAFGSAAVLFFFSLICALSVFFVIFFMVETKGKTFTEIQQEFGTIEFEEDLDWHDDIGWRISPKWSNKEINDPSFSE